VTPVPRGRPYAGGMARQTVATWEAAYLAGVNPKLFAAWARAHNLEPLRRQRIGESFVTVWSVSELMAASSPQPA
jgi:hypothetical protein